MADIRRLPTPVTDIWNWQMRAACRDLDTSLFFHPDKERGPTRARRELRAKQVCAGCPVRTQCRAHALSVREPYGVWGGLTESERLGITRDDTVAAVSCGGDPDGASPARYPTSPSTSAAR